MYVLFVTQYRNKLYTNTCGVKSLYVYFNLNNVFIDVISMRNIQSYSNQK